MSSINAAVVLLLGCGIARAGDAVVAGYNSQGAWTSVTYYASSNPAGGKDYKNAAAAREAALRDLKHRGGEGISRSAVIASSDRTGNFAVVRGKTAPGKEEIAVGFGKTPREAEASAFDQLAHAGATTNRTVMYRYFSYGNDAAAAH